MKSIQNNELVQSDASLFYIQPRGFETSQDLIGNRVLKQGANRGPVSIWEIGFPAQAILQ